MLDTIALTLDRHEFEVLEPDRFNPSARGLLTPPYYFLGGRGVFICTLNPTRTDLKEGRYAPRITLAKRKVRTGFALTLRAEFSAPKLILGNNFDELIACDFEQVVETLHRSLTGLGIRTSIDILRGAKVSAIHFSKNIPLTDYTSCSMVMDELKRIDLTQRLDLSHTDWRNEGHAVRYHANAFEVIFYDKIKDLEKAKVSEKRGIERDYGLQLDIFRDRAAMPKQLEVLRIEVRLGTRAKIRQVMGKIEAEVEATFAALFDARIAKGAIELFWSHVRSQIPMADFSRDSKPEQVLADLAIAANGTARPGKLLQQLGTAMLVGSVGFRGASAILSRHCSARSWQRYKRDLKRIPIAPSPSFNALKQVDVALSRFKPLKIKDFRNAPTQGSVADRGLRSSSPREGIR